jgi:hypothetical protein
MLYEIGTRLIGFYSVDKYQLATQITSSASTAKIYAYLSAVRNSWCGLHWPRAEKRGCEVEWVRMRAEARTCIIWVLGGANGEV